MGNYLFYIEMGIWEIVFVSYEDIRYPWKPLKIYKIKNIYSILLFSKLREVLFANILNNGNK